MKLDQPITVLSLFDGMSCGQQALERAGIEVSEYYASEIDKHAIAVTMHNYPNTKQLGSVVNVDGYSLPKIDLLIGGSPCQSFSFAGKRKGMSTKDSQEILTLDHYLQLKSEDYEFEGQSYLFWEYMRLLNECKPTYFLLENVLMGEKWERVLSKAIGVNAIEINSALVSAQNRKRLYWFGQIRERMFFNDNLCYICNKKNEQEAESGILGETQRKGEEEVLGETQIRQGHLQDLQYGIFENNEERNDKNLFGCVSEYFEDTERQESKQGKEGGLSKEISYTEQRKTFEVSKGLSEDKKRKRGCEEIGRESVEKNCKNNESSYSQRINWTEKEANKRATDYNFKYGEDLCCVQCGKKLNHRPYKSFVEGWNKLPFKSPSTLSEVQFNETRQNNGRVFDILEIGQIGEDLFGEFVYPIPQPKDKGILLKDILEREVDKKYFLSEKTIATITRHGNKIIDEKENPKQSCTIHANYFKMGGRDQQYIIHNSIIVASRGRNPENPKSRKSGLETEQQLEPRKDGKTNCLTSVQKDNLVVTANYIQWKGKGFDQDNRAYYEDGKSGTLDTKPERNKVLQINPSTESNGCQPYQQNRVYDANGISPALMAQMSCGTYAIKHETKIRRLTPTECERLQTVADGYTSIVSDTQRYRMLGNGWTVDVIAYIFSFMKP